MAGSGHSGDRHCVLAATNAGCPRLDKEAGVADI